MTEADSRLSNEEPAKIVSAEELERSLAAIERRMDGADAWAVKNVRAYIADLGLLAAGFRERGAAIATLQRSADEMREALTLLVADVEALHCSQKFDPPLTAYELANLARARAALKALPPQEQAE